MSLALQSLLGLVLSVLFIESVKRLGIIDCARSLLGVLLRASWVMRHRYSSDLRKERLVQHYSLRSLVLTLQLAIRFSMTLLICFAIIWLLSLILPFTLQQVLQSPLILFWSLIVAALYLPVRRRLSRGKV